MMPAMSTRTLALAAALTLGLAACAMKSPQQATPLPPPTGTPDPHQEITARWDEIRQWRLDARLAIEPDADLIATMSERPVTEAAATCAAPTPTTGTCADVCQLGDAICDNAATICRIADELAGDVWAHDKCASAKASCHEAEARCCACQPPTLGVP